MKTILTCALALFGILLPVSHSIAAIISDFGSDISPGDLYGSWVSNYNSGTSTVTASDDSGIQDGDTPFSPINLTMNVFRLTAAVTTDPGSNFNISVFDAEGDKAFATFNWSSFGSSQTTVDAAITFEPLFNPGTSGVSGWELAGGGGGQSLTVQFSQLEALTAIPEPHAITLLGSAFAWFLLMRRRHV